MMTPESLSSAGNHVASRKKIRTRLIAFYLPQFHPVPENDEWWGRGFTEWSNVAKAKPLFRGHYQPHMPADLGFYDLRLPETRVAQAELADAYGIEGFCYWHYWFNGQRILERPFDEVLASGEPDFPFCLAWANETWSRRWLGEHKDILLEQSYSFDDDTRHARWLLQTFSDPRYIRVSNRPLFLIYRPRDLPNPARTTEIFRGACLKSGLPEPYILGINAHCAALDCRSIGFDGTLDFEPQLGVLPEYMSDRMTFGKLRRNLRHGMLSPKLKMYDYREARQLMTARKKAFPTYPCIFVGWDNTPRRGINGIVVINSTPEIFGQGLSQAIQSVSHKSYNDRIVFLNAWNEWAEGNHLEPDLKYGRRFLETVRCQNSVPVEAAERSKAVSDPVRSLSEVSPLNPS